MLGGRAPLPLLTHDQEIKFARKISAGRNAEKRLARKGLTAAERQNLRHHLSEAEQAREALVLHNLPLVLSVAGRFRHSELDYDDLIQEGVTGLMKAADRYDPKRGTRFGTLAVWWIRQAIGRAIANTGRTVRLPVNRGWKVGQLRRITAELSQQMGDAPSLAEVAKRAGVTVQQAQDLLRDGQPTISLDAPPDDPDERSVMERVSDVTSEDPEGVVIAEGLQRALEEALARLDEREAEILKLRFGLGGGEAKPLRTIAQEWRMSPEGVRQISQRAMNRLRAMPQVRDLVVYLDE
jgi:RNA polymerase sigma factor (sigma-70 family)